MAELRWVLLGLGIVLLGGIWWRGTRRPGQARADADLRESALMREPTIGQAHASASAALSDPDEPAPMGAHREWGVSPLEPLSIKTADFDDVPVLDMPMIVEAKAADIGAAPAAAAARPPVVSEAEQARPVAAVAQRTDNSGRFAAPPPPNVNSTDKQKIVTLRICALGDERWLGKKLIDALEQQGLAFGRYQVFHRNHVDGRSMFCVASLIEPGVFDPEAMPSQEFRGITAFAVLPGPLEPVQTVEALIVTARRLAESLTGMVQDGNGVPLSPRRAAALREEVARFQAGLS